MGKVLVLAGGVLCLAGMAALAAAVGFFGKQREKLIHQISEEYKEEHQ